MNTRLAQQAAGCLLESLRHNENTERESRVITAPKQNLTVEGVGPFHSQLNETNIMTPLDFGVWTDGLCNGLILLLSHSGEA